MSEIINFYATEALANTYGFTNVVATGGEPGRGLPVGGTQGQIVTKASDDDYDYELTNSDTRLYVTQSNHSFSSGDWIALKEDEWSLADGSAGAPNELPKCVDVVIDADHFITHAEGDIISDDYLIPGRAYFISEDVAGTMVGYQPRTAGAVAVPVAVAISQTTARIRTGRPSIVANKIAKSCMNVGGDQVSGGTFKTDQNILDRAILDKNLPDKRVRVSIPSYNNSAGISNMRQLALDYKAAGYFVSYGVTALREPSGQILTAYNAWKAQVPTEADWAAANNIDRFYIGNEESWQAQIGAYTGVSAATVRSDVLTLSTSIKTAYPTMEVVYSDAQGTIGNWGTQAATSLGALDGLGFNMYGTNLTSFNDDIDYFQSQIGYKYFVTEWAANHPYADMLANYNDPNTGVRFTDEGYSAMLASRSNYMANKNIESYFFSLRFSTNIPNTTNWNILDNTDTFLPGANGAFGGHNGSAVPVVPLFLKDNQPFYLNTVRSAYFSNDITDVILTIPVAGKFKVTQGIDTYSNFLRIRTAKTPASASASGATGQFAWDSSYLYICVATNTWHRIAHATW